MGSSFPYHPEFISDKQNVEIQMCPGNNMMCCKIDVFKTLRIVTKPLLHKLSGLHAVQERIVKFNVNFKSRLIELTDTLIYMIYLQLKQSKLIQNPVTVIVRFYKYFNMELRSKLIQKLHKLDARSIVSVSVGKDCFTIDSSNASLLSAYVTLFNEVTEHKLLRFYRQTTVLESVIQQIQDVTLSEDCINNLFKISLCGVCSQSLDWTLYNVLNKTSFNVQLCPKYCHNVVRNCMAYYLSLVKSLTNYQGIFWKFTNQYILNVYEYSRLWIDKNQQSMTMFRMMLILLNNIDEKGLMCMNNNDMKSRFSDYRSILDIQDIDTEKRFLHCLYEGTCRYSDNLDQFNEYFTENFNILIEDFKNILKTLINPQSFIKHFLGRNCDHSNYNRCWNGFEIGQYHKSIIDFVALGSPQKPVKYRSGKFKKAIGDLIKIIQKSRSDLSGQPYVNKKTKSEIKFIEGSGQNISIGLDDEDAVNLKEKLKFGEITTSSISFRLPINDLSGRNPTEDTVIRDTNSSTNVQTLSKNNAYQRNQSDLLLFYLNCCWGLFIFFDNDLHI